jgi:hypothetical protein
MNVKEAISQAKQYISDVFRDENISNLGLEEVEFDDGDKTWKVTLGFSRPWNAVRNAITALTGEPAARRTYKVVSIRDSDSEVVSVKNRERELET